MDNVTADNRTGAGLDARRRAGIRKTVIVVVVFVVCVFAWTIIGRLIN